MTDTIGGMRRRYPLILLVVSIVLSAFPAAAQVPERAPLRYQGADGLWFRLDISQRMLLDLQELPELRLQVRLLHESLTLRTGQVDDLRRAVDIGTETIERLDKLVLQQSRRAEVAEERLRAWWRHPALWFCVGVVVSGVGAVVIAAQ